jgi:soluble lytic murein transglycosylase-like protein
MYTFLHSCRVILMGGFLLSTFLANTAKADQIVVLVDDLGHKIYVNTGESGSRVGWMTRSFQPGPSAATSVPPADIDKLVEQSASRFQVDPDLVRAVIRVESGFDAKAVSSKGAMGLMQLIPATAQRFGVANPFDPKQNIDGGVNYLRHLLDLFGGDLNLSLAAYNAGEHTVQRSGGIPAIAETRNYVRRVTSIYQTGDTVALAASKNTTKEPPTVPITRYVDEYGVVHFTNVE